MEALCLKGTVFSGKRKGSKFIRLPWVRDQIIEKLGFTPYPGTLNIRLTQDDSTKIKRMLNNAKAIEILPAEGFCLGRCFKAYLIDNVECAVVIPKIAEYPEDSLEIIASVNLREKLHLRDTDTVEVKMLL